MVSRGFWWFVPALACAVVLAVGPATAHAVCWPLAESRPVLLAYGSTYVAPDGTERSHSGVDLKADPGCDVLSVVDGVVSFAGRIPTADGSSVLAVTVEDTSGLRCTVMPLEALAVERGNEVWEGATIGMLAESGDRSTSEPHVHVSVRRGDTYLDPMSVLVVPASAVEAPEPTMQEAGAAVPSPEFGDGAVPLSSPAPLTATAVVPEPVFVQDEQPTKTSVHPDAVGAVAEPNHAIGEACDPGGAASQADEAAAVPAPALASRVAARLEARELHAGSPGDRFAAADALAVRRRSGSAALPRLAVLAACLPGVAALWPLIRRDRSSFAECVRARGDDVAGAVGR
jgi:hypothetical protein